eukprot:5139544-Pleurochrysis_carterae.AAC.2
MPTSAAAYTQTKSATAHWQKADKAAQQLLAELCSKEAIQKALPQRDGLAAALLVKVHLIRKSHRVALRVRTACPLRVRTACRVYRRLCPTAFAVAAPGALTRRSHPRVRGSRPRSRWPLQTPPTPEIGRSAT